jgi:hypothetical protein
MKVMERLMLNDKVISLLKYQATHALDTNSNELSDEIPINDGEILATAVEQKLWKGVFPKKYLRIN